MKAIEIIHLIGGEFRSVSPETLEQWIEIVRPMVSRKQFGKLYEQALAYLVCHKLKMAGHGENPLGDIGAIGVGFGIGSVSEGGSSVSFGASQTSNLAADAELGLTAYGVQYLQLRRSVIVPIHCSGELIDYPPKPKKKPDEHSGQKKRPKRLPVATDGKLGGVRVKPGSGLKVDADGSLSVDKEAILAGRREEGEP